MLRSRQKRATGIHFDDRGLYAVELTRARGRTALAGSARVDLEVSAGADRSTDSRLRTGFTAALRKARGHRGMRFENPYAALQSGAVHLKQRPHFFVRDAQRRGQLEWEARQFLPDGLGSYALDCFTTARAAFVVAARREGIEEVAAICRGAGIPRPKVDVAPLALCNAAESSGASSPVGIDLVLDFAGDRATMILLDRGELLAVDFCNWDGRYAPYAQGAVDIQEGEEAAATAADPARGEQLSRSLRRLMDLEPGRRETGPGLALGQGGSGRVAAGGRDRAVPREQDPRPLRRRRYRRGGGRGRPVRFRNRRGPRLQRAVRSLARR